MQPQRAARSLCASRALTALSARTVTFSAPPLPSNTGLSYTYRNPFLLNVEEKITLKTVLREKKSRVSRKAAWENRLKQAKEALARPNVEAKRKEELQARVTDLEGRLAALTLPPFMRPFNINDHKQHKAMKTHYPSRSEQPVEKLLLQATVGHKKYDRAIMETYIHDVGTPRAVMLFLDFGLTRAEITLIRGICKASVAKGIHTRLQQRSNRFFLPLLKNVPQLRSFLDIYEDAGQRSFIVVCADPIEGAKVADAIWKALPTKLMPWGGVFDGYPLSYEAMHAFKDLPDTDTLQGMAGAMVASSLTANLMSTLTAPLSAVPSLLSNPIAHLARTLQATEADKKAQEAAPAPSA